MEGILAIRQFLNTVGVKLRPEWARLKLSEILKKVELGLPVPDLGNIGRMFLIQANKSGKKYRVYVILEARLDEGNTSLDVIGYKYPYLPDLRRHRWALLSCLFLELAITGKTNRKLWRSLSKA